jgi:hypothetical protein
LKIILDAAVEKQMAGYWWGAIHDARVGRMRRAVLLLAGRGLLDVKSVCADGVIVAPAFPG